MVLSYTTSTEALLFMNGCQTFVVEREGYRTELGSVFPNTQKSQRIASGLWWSKLPHLLQRVKQGESTAHAHKTQTLLPMAGREGLLKTAWVKNVTRCLISLCIVLWLVDSEVIQGCFENLNYQPSGSNRFELYVLVVSMKLTCSTWLMFDYPQNNSRICLKILSIVLEDEINVLG